MRKSIGKTGIQSKEAGWVIINQIRRKAFFHLVLAAIGMLFLASSVADLTFQPGLSIPGPHPAATASTPGVEQNTIQAESDLSIVFQAVLALGFTAFLVLLIVSLVKKADPKQIKQILLGAIIPLILLFLLRWTTPPIDTAPSIESQVVEAPSAIQYDIKPLGPPPSALSTVIWICLITGVLLLAAWLIFKAFRQEKTADTFTLEADAALKAIEGGQDLRNVILHCYLQMTQIVKEELGIERQDSVTAREFERVLTSRGIPGQPIRQLTRLFEKVRYGGKTPDRQDEVDAVECLTAISRKNHPMEGATQ